MTQPNRRLFLRHTKSKQVFLFGGGFPPGGDSGTLAPPSHGSVAPSDFRFLSGTSVSVLREEIRRMGEDFVDEP